ncbi:WXG100 family type VII secretion target [Nocardia sp. NPDC019395]|uniref:WXG100 family type VII secretion target n=1 Tax=Nocardia sp. NPDC019395 TaxID=3154686 RepID=UPI0034095D95
MNGNEPPRITDGGERSKHFKHVEISESFTPLGSGEAFSIAGRYSDLSANWEAGVEVFSASIGKSIAGAWEGEAAEAARDAITRYTRAAQDLTTPLTELGNRVWDSAQAIIDTKSRLPEPVEEKAWWHKDSWPWVGTNRDGVIEDRQEQAQAVMNDNYVQPFLGIDGLIPAFPEPIDPTQPLDVPVPPAPAGTAPDTPSAPGTSTPTTPGTPTAPGETPETEDTPQELGTTQPQDTTAASTTPGSTPATPSGTTPGTPAPASTTPSSVTTPPGGTPGMPGAPGTPPGSPQAPGRTVPGAPGPESAGRPSGAPGSPAARGPMGAGPMGAPMGGARGGQGDNESTRGLPDYLINHENTAELLGETPKTIPGGVIGDNPEPDDDLAQ